MYNESLPSSYFFIKRQNDQDDLTGALRPNEMWYSLMYHWLLILQGPTMEILPALRKACRCDRLKDSRHYRVPKNLLVEIAAGDVQ